MSRPKLTKDQRLRARTKRAEEAGRMLRSTSTMVHTEGVLRHCYVEVDAKVLLGTALTHAPAKYLGFDVLRPVTAARRRMSGDVVRVKVRRTVLRHVRPALRRQLNAGEVRAWIDADGVHLRWHDGRGGLDFVNATHAAYHDQRELTDCFAVDLRAAAREQAA